MRSRERGTGSGQSARGKVRPESKGQGQARERGARLVSQECACVVECFGFVSRSAGPQGQTLKQ